MKGFALFVSLLFPLAANAAPWKFKDVEVKYETEDATITEFRRIPQGDIRVLPREAMEDARKTGENNLVWDLRERSDETLPFLPAYSRSNHANILRGVLTLIENSAQSKAALRLVSEILARPQAASRVGEAAVNVLANYRPDQLKIWGQSPLREGLLVQARRENWRSSNTTLFVLRAFPDARTRAFLKTIARQKPRYLDYYEGQLPPTPRAFAANLVLANWGDKTAISRLQADLERGRTFERIYLCRSIEFISSRSLLQKLLPMLNDARPVKENRMFAMGTDGVCRETKLPPTLMRDVALNAMKSKLEGREYDDWWRFKPAEKHQVLADFSAFLQGKPRPKAKVLQPLPTRPAPHPTSVTPIKP